MSKLILGAGMVLTGLLGLSATACGLFFLFVLPIVTDDGLWSFIPGALWGFIPGALMLWLTVVLWKYFRSS